MKDEKNKESWLIMEKSYNYTLTQDNGSCNDFTKLTVEICGSDLVHELKKYFKWRKDVTASRLYKQGSHNYDLFIKYLHEKGY